MLELGKAKQAKCLEVKIGGEVYHIPTSRNLPVPHARKLVAIRGGRADADATWEFFFDFLGDYLGEALNLLDMEDIHELMAAWNAMNAEERVGLGESLASSPS